MNPYESPSSPSETGTSRRKLRARVIWGSLALLFFLLPSICSALVHLFPPPIRLPWPKGDHFISRASIMLGFPAGPILLVALLGASGSVLMMPLKLSWRIKAAIAVVPLLFFEVFAIAAVLVACGRLKV